MATYSITINENSSTGKNLINLLKSMNGVVLVHEETANAKKAARSEFLTDLKESVNQVKNNQTKPLKNLIDG